MAKTTVMTPLKMAAKSFVDGDEVAGEKFTNMLQTIINDDSTIKDVIEFVMESSDGHEPHFYLVLDALAKRSVNGLQLLKDLASSHQGESAIHLANRVVLEVQKKDFFLACKGGEAAIIQARIIELGAQLASKITDENGQTGLHIACRRDGGASLKLLKVFREAGFDEEARDRNGVTPLMIMSGARQEVEKKPEVQDSVRESVPSTSPKIIGTAIALDGHQDQLQAYGA